MINFYRLKQYARRIGNALLSVVVCRTVVRANICDEPAVGFHRGTGPATIAPLPAEAGEYPPAKETHRQPKEAYGLRPDFPVLNSIAAPRHFLMAILSVPVSKFNNLTNEKRNM